ncbi:MAG: hypothetical protein ABSA12_07060 [Verrucomicrobiia bacterium]
MTKPFTPFVIPNKSASTGAPPSPSAAGPQPSHADSQPTITLKRDGDRITHIIVRCSCERVVELACEY